MRTLASVLCAACALPLASLSACAPAPRLPTSYATGTVVAPAGHQLVWSDEFSGNGLPDARRWTYDTQANATGWYNNEAQYYAARRLENTRVADGLLTIQARQESAAPLPADNGQSWTSGKLVTKGRGWTYGRFEVRAKLACGRGAWPAIWMLPAQSGDSWPLSGEIDIMEHVGHDQGVVHGTVHTGAYNHVAKTERGGPVILADACDAFHRYQVDWSRDAVAFLVDDREYYRFSNDGSGDPARWPFDKPFNLILNVAVGGDWGGAQGIDEAAFPSRMHVDYVRVFQPIVD